MGCGASTGSSRGRTPGLGVMVRFPSQPYNRILIPSIFIIRLPAISIESQVHYLHCHSATIRITISIVIFSIIKIIIVIFLQKSDSKGVSGFRVCFG